MGTETPRVRTNNEPAGPFYVQVSEKVAAQSLGAGPEPQSSKENVTATSLNILQRNIYDPQNNL